MLSNFAQRKTNPKSEMTQLYIIEKLHTVYLSCISQSSKTAKITMFINYKHEIYALSALNV